MIYFLYLLIVAALVGFDQWLKAYIVANLGVGSHMDFLPGFIRFTYVRNTGAAWSSFSGSTWLLTILSVVLVGAVAYLLIKKIVRHPLGIIAALLIMGGGVGNMIDRIARGYVVDMFDLQLFSYPVFNLADCFVVVGAILGAIYYLKLYDKDKELKNGSKDSGNN